MGPDRSERNSAEVEDAIDHYDPAEAEKKLEAEDFSSGTASPVHQEHADGRLWLTEDQAYARALLHPNDTRPVYIIYAPDDKDNPRNWSMAKKWYITCFVSWLNVMTCLCAGGYSSGVPQLIAEFNVSGEVGTVGLSMYILVSPHTIVPYYQ